MSMFHVYVSCLCFMFTFHFVFSRMFLFGMLKHTLVYK